MSYENEVSDNRLKISKNPDIREPHFPDQEYRIDEYGAITGGKEKCTEAINQAIKECSTDGGGKVIIPEGLWLTGPIEMMDNVNLHLMKGAVIKFSTDLEDFKMVETQYEGLRSVRFQSPISGNDLENIAITGRGIIDGSGEGWRMVKRFKMTDRQWEDLLSSGGAVSEDGRIWWPSEAALNGADLVASLEKQRISGEDVPLERYREAGEYLRPVMVSLVNCKHVLLDGPTFQNSPNWNIHPLMSEDIIIRNLTVRNPWYAQNGDGLDIDSCKNVLVEDCMFDVGDDAICLKSGKDGEGRRRDMPCEDIFIRDCIVYHGHGGFVVGSEMSGGVKNVYVSDCTFLGTDVGLRFKSTRGRGGLVENIYINNIKMIKIPTEAIKFNLFYEDKGKEPLEKIPVTEETPGFRNIHIKDIDCIGADRAVLIKGLPEMPVENIKLENISIKSNRGLECLHARDVELINSDIIPENGPQFNIEESDEIIVNGIACSGE